MTLPKVELPLDTSEAFIADVVELVDTPDSKSGSSRSDGSTPSIGTKLIDKK